MPVSEERFPIAQVTRRSRDGWRTFAERHRTNPTALIEVLGLHLGEVSDDPPPWLAEIIVEAAGLQDRRRQRGD